MKMLGMVHASCIGSSLDTDADDAYKPGLTMPTSRISKGMVPLVASQPGREHWQLLNPLCAAALSEPT